MNSTGFPLASNEWQTQTMETENTAQKASSEDMDRVFALCRNCDWLGVLSLIQALPHAATTPMILENHISTSLLHQAITSKGDTDVRAQVIITILQQTPSAARMRNGYGSLPLHVIAQRNTKLNSPTKERLMYALVNAFPGALVEKGGVGKRTPLHIIFTGKPLDCVDYILIRNVKPCIKSVFSLYAAQLQIIFLQL
jgi:hypothetical protein